MGTARGATRPRSNRRLISACQAALPFSRGMTGADRSGVATPVRGSVASEACKAA